VLTAGMNRLAWDVRHGSEYAPLKRRARDEAVAAVRKVREEASYREMETAAVQAVQPMIREYEHQQACQFRTERPGEVSGFQRASLPEKAPGSGK
jgi:hypothetical protein